MANRHRSFLVALAIASFIPVLNSGAQSLAAERAALLAADRKLGSSGNAPDVITAISAQFADSVSFISLGQIFKGVAAAREALTRNPDNAKSTATWAPIQGDVSADGKVGYTMGYLTIKAPDGKETPGKYVSYWIKERGAWRVLVYKRAGRAPGAAAVEEPAPVKPALKAVKNSAADSTRFAQELDRAERNFSDEAGKIGLGPAFTKNAADDAHHVGGPTDAEFRRGPAEIGAGVVAGGEPPLGSVVWAPDVVYVANSGDLGITFGYITISAPGNPSRKVSYLTIWKRNSVTDKWKLAVE